jgi:hypothetical protein
LIAQLSSTHAKFESPEHDEQPSAFQNRFWRMPFWNSKTWERTENVS